MSASGGMSQLLKGIIIGVVLIMAIIGTMSLLNNGNPLSTLSNSNTNSHSTEQKKQIESPEITLNPDTTTQTNNSATIGDLNAEIKDDEYASNTETSPELNKPILENERTAQEIKAEQAPVIDFGMMELNAINPNNNNALKTNFVVFDKNNTKVAESKDSSSASYRLPTGQYKVETTLMRIDEATNQSIPVLTKSRYIIVRTNSTSRQTFELEPPATTGVLQVSANINDKNVRANFVIQKINGEVVASRNNVTNSLFKLNSGTYKVSVNSGNSKDFRSVEIKAGESIQTVFDLKEVATQGKLLVRVFDTRSSNPVRADIKIMASDGKIVQDLKAITQTELSLASGNYRISVIGPNGTSNRNIKVSPNQSLNEIFRFESKDISNQSQTNTNTTQINENVSIKPVENQNEKPASSIDQGSKVTLSINAQDQATKRPIKSNIYIQTVTGKHLDKKTYVDSASFNLEPGVYKVTVRSKNRQNNVKTIRLSQNQNINETFLMLKPNTDVTQTIPSKPTPNSGQVPKPAINKAIQTGFLNISMQAPNNQQAGTDLRSHFIVSTLAGQKIVELTSVKVGNFKLDMGEYVVTAIRNKKRQTRRITVRPNQNTRLAFNTSEFLAAKGVLRSQIVNESGRPLKGNLTVTNMSGQIVARANNVSSAVFNLPPERHSIRVNFQGLTGSELVNISSNETTVQTFTIAPQQNNNGQQRNNSRDIKEILKEKIRKEIKRTF